MITITKPVVYCDVDDTLIMHTDIRDFLATTVIAVIDPRTGHPIRFERNDNVITLLKDKYYRGYAIHVWSMNGGEWAEAVVQALGLLDIVAVCSGKPSTYIDDKDAVQWLPPRTYIAPKARYK